MHKFRIDRPYLLLPVRTGAPKRRVALDIAGTTIREFDIEFAASAPEFEVFLDVSSFAGQDASLQAVGGDDPGLASARLSDEIPDAAGLYREATRPQFHFTSRRGWLNDPNGLVYANGLWHLYYQHNPYGWHWGNMHWGHAVSEDLVHWRELGIALYPRQYGDWAYSGSGFVAPDGRIGIAYTSTGRGECIAFSDDGGLTFAEIPGNPVVRHRGRDPKVFWHEGTRRWVMAVYDEADDQRWIAIHTSPDLRVWTFASRIAGFYECPELFRSPSTGTRIDRSGCCTRPMANTCWATSTAASSVPTAASSASGMATSMPPRPTPMPPTGGGCSSGGDVASTSPACPSTSRWASPAN